MQVLLCMFIPPAFDAGISSRIVLIYGDGIAARFLVLSCMLCRCSFFTLSIIQHTMPVVVFAGIITGIPFRHFYLSVSARQIYVPLFRQLLAACRVPRELCSNGVLWQLRVSSIRFLRLFRRHFMPTSAPQSRPILGSCLAYYAVDLRSLCCLRLHLMPTSALPTISVSVTFGYYPNIGSQEPPFFYVYSPAWYAGFPLCMSIPPALNAGICARIVRIRDDAIATFLLLITSDSIRHGSPRAAYGISARRIYAPIPFPYFPNSRLPIALNPPFSFNFSFSYP